MMMVLSGKGWRRCIAYFVLQVSFSQKTNCRALWRKMTYEDKTPYASSPICTAYPHDTMQYNAAICNTLQHSATHCNTLQHSTAQYNIATPCSALQLAFLHCNTLQHTATHRNTLQHTYQGRRVDDDDIV